MLIKRKTTKKHMKSEHWFCLIGLTPIILIYTYLRFIPIIRTFYMSFFNWDMVALKKPFIGLKNFRDMFAGQLFVKALLDTTIIAFSILIIIMPLSLLIANTLVKGIKFKSWFEAFYFLPVIMPMVPITVIWKWILDADFGLFNYFLSFFGIASKAWLVNPNLAIFSVILLTVWKNVGYNMLIFSVGLKGIPKEYYEAATIDGATGFKSFLHISIPLLKPITVYVSVMTLIKGYNVFSQVYILASDVQGAPSHLVRVLVYDIIENGFRFYKMGYASAEAVVLFMIVFALTLVQIKMAGDNMLSGKKVKK